MYKEAGSNQELSFEDKKHNFFTKLGLRAKEYLKTHKDEKLGALWGKRKTKEDWRNVSKHCLVEAARAEALSDLLQLPAEVKQRLFAATILHDFDKKDEIIYTASQSRTVQSFDEAYAKSEKKLQDAGIDPGLIEVASSVGHASLPSIEQILVKKTETMSDQDIIRLAMHYIDDYTIEDRWAQPVEDGKNDFDRRMDANDTNPKYAKIAEAGFYIEQRRVGNLVEQKLAELITQRSDKQIEIKLLPEKIDQIIRGNIEKQ